MRLILTIAFLLARQAAQAQTLGGNAAYNFLKFPFTPQASASGGVNVSYQADLGIAVHNPALLQSGLHQQATVNFTEFSGLTAYQLGGAWHSTKQQTTYGASLFYFDYGDLERTDPSGNRSGSFRASDYVVQFSGAKRYLTRWQYGLSVKLIRSAYDLYRSTAVAADAAILYSDTTRWLTISVLARNMGSPLSSYAGTRDDLPFDLQAGITQKLKHAPFAFSLTLQQLHRYRLVYRDSVFNAENNFTTSNSFFDNVFNHMVLATHVNLGHHLEATIGYNRLRRNEGNIGGAGNGLTGFSAGFLARFEKLHFSYARSSYQNGIAYNQLGINLMMDRLFGAGRL